jgi:hypothetical protein
LGCGDFERFEAEAFYGGEDIIGGFGQMDAAADLSATDARRPS